MRFSYLTFGGTGAWAVCRYCLLHPVWTRDRLRLQRPRGYPRAIVRLSRPLEGRGPPDS